MEGKHFDTGGENAPERNEKAREALEAIASDLGFAESDAMKQAHQEMIADPLNAGQHMEAWFKEAQERVSINNGAEEYARAQCALIVANWAINLELGLEERFFREWEEQQEVFAQLGFPEIKQQVEDLMNE